jgi:hypothetical protein
MSAGRASSHDHTHRYVANGHAQQHARPAHGNKHANSNFYFGTDGLGDANCHYFADPQKDPNANGYSGCEAIGIRQEKCEPGGPFNLTGRDSHPAQT